MSNLLFPMPSPPNGAWAWPVRKTPSFKTVVQTPASNRGENRISLTPNPIYLFEYDFSYLKGDYQTLNSALANLVGFHAARGGAADDWLFNDPYDNGIQALALVNGNFEQSASIPPPGWTATGTAVLTYDTTTQYDGVRSLNVASFGGFGAASGRFPATPGQTFSTSCFAKFIGGGSTTNAALALVFRNAAGAAISVVQPTTTSASWVPLTADGVAPAGTATVNVELFINGGSSNGQGEYDDVTLSQIMLGPQLIGYGDGATTQFQIGRSLNGGFEMMQNVFPTALFIGGAQVPAGPQASGNQWYCGLENLLQQSAAFNLSPWIGQNSGASNPVITANSTAAPDGTTTADTLAYPSTIGSSVYSDVLQILPTGPISSGGPLCFSVYLKVASGTPSLQVIIADSITGKSFSNAVTVTSSWTRFNVQGTFDRFNNNIYVILRSLNQAAATILAWGAQLERWTSPTSYVATTTTPQFPRGLVTFATAPGSGAQVTADFSYLYRCRFLEDEWGDLEEFLYQVWENKSVKFKSLIL